MASTIEGIGQKISENVPGPLSVWTGLEGSASL